MKIIENKILDGERALYGSEGLLVLNCRFEGEADGESALKESRNISAEGCFFGLRYPLWHDTGLYVKDCELNESCRAPIWYSRGVRIEKTKLHGIKALRECSDVKIECCDIKSDEFGWFTDKVKMTDTSASGEYFMMRSAGLDFERVTLLGKYSFQYITDSVFENCIFNTKDAFWHAKNVTVRNSVINGEYLAWYAENITFENCKISGTQPLCYCRGLKLIGCEMTGADFSFEKSDVEATLTAPVISIKNPRSGFIRLPYAEKIILEGKTDCEIIEAKETETV